MEWSFKLPVSVGGGGEFVMRELTVMDLDEIQDRTYGAAAGDPGKLAAASKAARRETLKASIVSWKLKPVTAGDAEAWYFALRPKERACVESAYAKIHALSKDEEDWFAESMEPAKGKAGAGGS